MTDDRVRESGDGGPEALEGEARSRGATADAEAVLAGLGDAVLGLDADGRVTYLDDRATSLLGPTGRVAGLRLGDLLSSEHARAACDRALESGRPAGFESTVPEAAGRFEFRVRPRPGGLSVLVEELERAGREPPSRPRASSSESGSSSRSDPGDRGPDGGTRRLSSRDETPSALEELCAVAGDADADFEAKVRRLLTVGRDYLGVTDGALVEVDPEEDRHRVAITTDDPETVEAGAEAALSETFCRDAVAGEELLSVHDASDSPYRDLAIHEEAGVACYLGGSVTVDGELYGTVCFLGREARRTPFGDAERQFVTLLVRWLGRELERRHREHELERYEAIVETVEDGIYALDGDGRYTFVNGALVKMTGYDRERILGNPAPFLTTDGTTEDADRIQEYLEAGVAPVGVLETELRTADGVTIPVENRFAPFPGESGETGRVCVVRNITGRRHTERKFRGLHETAQRLAEARSETAVCRRTVEACRTVLELETAGVWRFESEREVFVPVAATGERTDLPELPVDESTARDVLRAGEPRVVPVTDDPPANALGGESVRSTVLAPMGEYGVVACATSTEGGYVDRDADLLGLLAGNANAAVERARREVDLRAAREELRRSNEELEQFAYAVSHDLREPLRMVSNYLQLLERRYGEDLDGTAHEYIDYAVDGADRLREMIDGLLEYARVEGPDRDPGPVDMNAVVEDALRNLEVQIEESDARVEVEDLPTVTGDHAQLVEVVQNLVSNGIRYVEDGPPSIAVTARRLGGAHEIAVTDDGVGMDDSAMDRAFDLFERLDGDGPGTGIGLALCEKIVRAHDGEIRIDSEPGAGTTVAFTLPAGDDQGRR